MQRMGRPAAPAAGVVVALGAAGWLVGCASDVDRPADVDPPKEKESLGLFTLNTDLGPMDVLVFRDAPDGVRTVRVHRITPIGDHETSEIRVLGSPDPDGGDAGTVSYALVRAGVEACRFTRRVTDGRESEVEVELYRSGESLAVRASRAEGGVLLEASVVRGGTRSEYSRFLDRRRAAEPGYVEGIRDEIGAFYPDGPLAGSEDLETLYAVIGSADWGNHLVVTEGSGGAPPDPGFVRRLRVGCVISGVVGKIACFAARFTPYAWLPCLVAEGVNLACLTYNIRQIIDSDGPEGPEPPPPPPPCGCPCGCD